MLPPNSLIVITLLVRTCTAQSNDVTAQASDQITKSGRGSNGRVLNSSVIRVAVEQWKPHMNVEVEEDGSISISGPMAQLLDRLATAYNFRYRLIKSIDGRWGAPKENGDWNGMIGMVMRNEVDIALGPFGLTASRANVVKFSNPVIIDYYRILLKRNSPVADPWSFLKPFGVMVWCAIVVSFFVVTVIIAYSLVRLDFVKPNHVDSKKCSNTEQEIPIPNPLVTGFNTFTLTFWNLFALFMQQSIIWRHRDSLIMFVFGIWLMAALVLMRSYGSGLTSLLAVRTVPVGITGLKDLIEKSDLELILEDSTALTEYLTNVQSGIFKKLADENHRTIRLKSSVLFESADIAVRKGKSALLVEETSCMVIYSNSYTERGKCEFILAREKFWPLVFCIIGQQSSPIIDIFNANIRTLVEQDLYNKWISEQVSNFSSCLKAPTTFTITEPYNITSIWGMFVVLCSGLLLSLLVFLLEICCSTFRM